MSPKRLLILIVIISLLSLYIAVPSQFNLNFNQGPVRINRTFIRPPIDFNLFGKQFFYDFQLKLGLDLQGGTHLVLRAVMDKINPEDKLDALESARDVISRRVDLFGVSEPVIQTSVNQDNYQLIVELPGVGNIDTAVNLIGQTAQLEFKEQDPQLAAALELEATPSAQAYLASFKSTGLSGQDLKKALVQFDPNTGAPVVGLKFTPEGGQKFAEITKRNLDKPVAIFIDQYPVTIPRVQNEITTGEAVITGEFTTEEAKNMAIQLNAGALPVPIEIQEQRNVGATLGQESVQKSLQAGMIGLSMVMLFMAAYYGFSGVLADIALIIYGLITLALYKLFSITLTLPGLAGFILSVGMAVDSNILIFERMKEELRAGKDWKIAMELGFGRAWDSIKDANLATLTICFILFNPLNWEFLNRSGMIRGFALTLALGIAVSLFTGIIVTRTLMRLFYKGKNTN